MASIDDTGSGWKTRRSMRSARTWGSAKAAMAFRMWEDKGNRVELDVSDCDLMFLPPEIGTLSKLLILRCTGNYLKELPDELCHMSGLTTLLLSNNYITRLPDNINQLKELQNLSISCNKLRRFPDGMASMHKLSIIRAADNLLEELPEAMGDMESLQTLNISSNKLAEIPYGIIVMHLKFYLATDNPLNDPETPTTTDAIAKLSTRVKTKAAR